MDPTQRAQIYTISLETLRICAILLEPFMPSKSAELLDALNVPAEDRTWKSAEVGKAKPFGDVKRAYILFPERDSEVKLLVGEESKEPVPEAEAEPRLQPWLL